MPAIQTVFQTSQSVEMTTHVSHGGRHELSESTVVSGDGGRGIVTEPDCQVGGQMSRLGHQGVQDREVLLHMMACVRACDYGHKHKAPLY